MRDDDMRKDLQGKVAWITGGGSGIGLGCARELARRGADVALSGRRLDRLEQAAASLRALGVRALAVGCDVRVEAQQRDAVARVVAELGGLDVAIANAGFSVDGRIEELSGEDWRRQLETNVVGVALTARCAIEPLTRTRGRLGLVGSVSGFMAAPGFAAYHASKHAVRAIGLTLSMELMGTGVSCTTLHPGFVTSEIGQVDRDGQFDPARADRRPQWLMWSTERAARVMVEALLRRRREVVFTGHGKLAAFLFGHWPAFNQVVMRLGPAKRQAAQVRDESPR